MANQGDAGLAPDDFHIIHLVSELGTTPGLKDSGEIFGAWDFCRQVLQDSLNGEESVFLFLWVHNSVSTAKQEMAADAHPVKSYILNMNPSLADTARQRHLLLHFINNKALFAMGFFAHFLVPVKTSEIFSTYIWLWGKTQVKRNSS